MTDVQFDPETGEILEPPVPAVQPAPERPKRARKPKPKRGNGRVHIPENETPRERFLRSSSTRMKQALTAIDLIAGFGRSRANYEYGDGEAERLASRLEAAVARMRRELARPPTRKEERDSQRSFDW
jgi:hypothetical protein